MTILDELYDQLDDATHYGHYLSALCPFHPDTRPSLLVYEDGYRCLSCGAFGKTHNLLTKISSPTGIIVKPNKPDLRNPFTRWTKKQSLSKALKIAWKNICSTPSSYLKTRGIKHKYQKHLGLGYRDDWYTFPIRDQDKRIIGAVARKGEENTSQAKYIYPSGQDRNVLYVPSWKKVQKQDIVFLTFGIIDAVSIYLCGYAAISTTTGKRLQPEALDGIRKRILIIPDWGEQVEASVLSAKLGWRGKVVNMKFPYPTKDVNDLYLFDKDSLVKSLEEVTT